PLPGQSGELPPGTSAAKYSWVSWRPRSPGASASRGARRDQCFALACKVPLVSGQSLNLVALSGGLRAAHRYGMVQDFRALQVLPLLENKPRSALILLMALAGNLEPYCCSVLAPAHWLR
ncbi:hypothetical protein A6R68_12528, partial [Neotoma lepida]